MKVDEFESVDLTLLELGKGKALTTLWPKRKPHLLRKALAIPAKPFGWGASAINRVAQGAANVGTGVLAHNIATDTQFDNPDHEAVGDATAHTANIGANILANTGFNKLARGIGHTKDVLSGYHDANIWKRMPWGSNPFGRGLKAQQIDTSGASKLADLPPDANAWGRVEGGSYDAGYRAGTENARISALETEVAELKAREKAAGTAGKTAAEIAKINNKIDGAVETLRNQIDANDLKNAGLKHDLLQAIEKGNNSHAERLKKELFDKYGETLGGNGTFQQTKVDPSDLSPEEQRLRYGPKVDDADIKTAERKAEVARREADVARREAEVAKAAEQADAKARIDAADKAAAKAEREAAEEVAARQAEFDKMKATSGKPLTKAEIYADQADYERREKAAIDRILKRGDVSPSGKITAAAIEKEMKNPTGPVIKAKTDPVTKAWKGTGANSELGFKPKPADSKAAEIAIKNRGVKDVVIKTGAKTFGTSASSVVIGDVANITNAEWLKKLGLHHATGEQAIKQTVKALGGRGAKLLALSFIPILNVALWGHDAYAITAAAVKSMDPDEQDKNDAGRHRQVALQQMSQVMLSGASMNEKIDQIDHLFSDSATNSTKQPMLAQIKARNAEERVGITKGDRQHFRTANPEFQAQLDKGPSKLGPQEVVPRNEDIWNSSYDDKEQILPVTFDAEGNLATGPNTKADFKNSLDGLVAKQAEYLTWKRLHPTTRSHPINAKIDAMENAIAEVRVAIRSAPEDRKTAFKNYVFNVLAQTETQVASNESAIMKGALLAEGPFDWLAAIKNWAIDRENLPKSGGAIRGKTSLAKGVKDLDPSDIEDLTKVKPRYDIEGNVWKRISGMSTKDQPFYDPKLDIKGFKPDTVAQAKADYKKPKVDKPVLTVKDLAKSANLRKAFIKTFNTPVTSTNVDDVIATNTGKNVSSAISKAISSPQFVPSGKEQKMLDRIKDKRKKYSKYTKAEQALMIKTGLTKNTFKQAHAQASANSDSLKIMKLKNGKTIKYFVWNGKKYSV